MTVLLIVLGIYLTIWWGSLAISSFRLSRLAGHPEKLKSMIPIHNVHVVYRLVGLSYSEANLMIILSFFIPMVAAVLVMRLAARMAASTGRPAWLGVVATIPPITFYGLAGLALTARRLQT
jgi:hypothetical protein